MDDAVTRKRTRNGIQTPVAYLNCNFSPPVGGKPALFTHNEVITLFHEFGHGLHHLLTRVEQRGVSGINGVEWDAVELPSQFMENFCWEWDVVRGMSGHVDTGAELPRSLFDKMLAAKNFQNGLQSVRQLEFSLFDMHLHYDFDPNGSLTPLQLLERVREQVAVVLPPEYNRFPNNFSHIFAGGYAAGYYSYKWAEVLVGGRLQLVRGSGRAQPGGRRALPARDPGRRWQPPGVGVVYRLPRTRAENRCAIAPQRHGHCLGSRFCRRYGENMRILALILRPGPRCRTGGRGQPLQVDGQGRQRSLHGPTAPARRQGVGAQEVHRHARRRPLVLLRLATGHQEFPGDPVQRRQLRRLHQGLDIPYAAWRALHGKECA